MMYGYGYGNGNGFDLFMMLGMFLFFALVVVGIYFLVRGLSKTSHHEGHQSNSNALQILSERYARGEIDEKEYNSVKAELRKL